MADSHKRIAAAFIVGAFLIASAFVISRNGAARATEEALAYVGPIERNHITVEDSNGDGVPNWQDELIKTDPLLLSDTPTSNYEEPKTVTGKFALGFFKDFLRAKTYGVFGDSKDELAAEAVEELSKTAVDELFTEEDIVLFEESDKTTLHSFGNQVALIILSQPNAKDSEGIILQDYLRYNDKERLNDLDPIALSYTSIVKKLLETPVPKTYVKEHLDLVNAVNAVREDVRGMQKIDDDPMYTLLRLKRYEDDVFGMANAIVNLHAALKDDGVTFNNADPFLKIVSFTR